jgi:Trk K+ transport system NAD-binding subunit
MLDAELQADRPRHEVPAVTLPEKIVRLWRHSNRYLRIALISQLTLLLSSILVFHFFFPLSFVNAIYFTSALITTVGLGDINLLSAAAPLKLFGVVVMLCGAILMAVIYALIAEFVVNQRIESLLGAPVEDMHDHYVVAGLGTVGFRVASALHEAGERVVAIELAESARFVPQLRALGIQHVIGDTLFEDTLARAKIARARAFIAATSNDLVNIEAALNARALRPDIHVVLRVFDRDLAVQARRSLDIPASFSTSELSAPVFVSTALGHEVPQVLSIPVDHPGAEGLTLLHLRVEAVSGMAGRSIRHVAIARGGAILYHQPAGANRGYFAPSSETMLAEGDLFVLAVAGHTPIFADEALPEPMPSVAPA